ncbi:MAG TPA: KH domain-containing protein [Candidatus Eremiobacteraceae bacterium]|nr:KH domain-containing protein [Candidatus Eremiobacteraceae bacterium]
MPDRPKDLIDYDDDEPVAAGPPAGIDIDDDDEFAPPLRDDVDDDDAEAEIREDDEGDSRDVIGRAAAVLKYIVEQIVDEPDKIAIGATEDDRGPVLLLRVADDDRGKIIGRQGRIVHAIRTIVKAASVGTGEKVNVEILD